jgi:hypothetical protein
VRQCVRARPVLTAGACSVSHALIAHSQFAAVISYIPSSLCSTQFENGAFLTAQLTISCDDDSEHRAYWVAFSAVALVTYALGGEFEWGVRNNSHSSDVVLSVQSRC